MSETTINDWSLDAGRLVPAHRCAAAVWVHAATGALLMLFENFDFEHTVGPGLRERRPAYWWAISLRGHWRYQQACDRRPPPPVEWAGEWVRWMSEVDG